ncbi:hypothetical protein [uncultured Porphyromonas sp.]|uniref:hypothetical protein n=1 Tax=uncultured Porphyromonas sp. TaxID=159274 RepID=UPI002051BB47|nr:hypothetical protein [uncultured Porphyromonas sp.]DAX36760.1 MAG TPA: Protein of unknown function (DUF3896) [Caudoviricetes sp.]
MIEGQKKESRKEWWFVAIWATQAKNKLESQLQTLANGYKHQLLTDEEVEKIKIEAQKIIDNYDGRVKTKPEVDLYHRPWGSCLRLCESCHIDLTLAIRYNH